MQFAGFVDVNGERLKLLVRVHKTYVSVKLRTTGRDGRHLDDEETYLLDAPDALKQLKAGKVVHF